MDYLSKSDYLSILKFYKIQINDKMTTESIKQTAESILASKLCKCIKNVDKTRRKMNESRSIAICKNSIIKKKGFNIFRFTCKNKPRLISKKNTKNKLIKSFRSKT